MPGGRLVVATWNLWGGNAPGVYTRERGIARGALADSPASRERDPARTWRRRLPLLADDLTRVEPDVVALQESTRLTGGRTCAAELSDRLEMQVCEDDHARGLAILSRSAIRSTRGLELAADRLGYPTPLLAELDVRGRTLTLVVLHLPLARSGDRTPLVRELAGALGALEAPLVVCGDLNAPPGDPVVEELLAAGLVDSSASAGPTVPNPEPSVRLDYVLVRGAGDDPRRLSPREGEMYLAPTTTTGEMHVAGPTRTVGHDADELGFLPSDHLGIVVELQL